MRAPLRTLLLWFGASLLLGACATSRMSRQDIRDRLRQENELPPPAPVTMTLMRLTASGKVIEARRSALLISDTELQVKVQNHTGNSLYLKLDQTPNAEGVLPLDQASDGPGYSFKGDGLYKLDSDEEVTVAFPIHHGMREGHVTLTVTGDSSGEKSYAEAKVSFRARPALEYYGDDELPFKTAEGIPDFGLDKAGGEREKAFYVEMIPGPPDGTTCVIALETVADDGTMLSQVKATLGTPAYRAGPFHVIAGGEVRPNAHRYRRTDLVDGDPGDEVVSPAPRDRTDLIATGELRVRRVVCQ